MVNEDDNKPVKKPIPLPRKSLHKENKSGSCKESNDGIEKDGSFSQKKTEGKGFVREDWKSASGSYVYEKSRMMKNEVQKLEKSVKSIITRRRSVHPKSQTERVVKEHNRSESLPDDSILFNISFNSPLTDGKSDDSQSTSYLEDDDDGNYYEKSLSPPPYPPPDLPDESLYDKMRSFKFSDQHSLKSTSSDSASTFSDVSSNFINVSSLDSTKGSIREEEASERSSYGASDIDDRYVVIDHIRSKDVINSQPDYLGSLTNIPESDTLILHSTQASNVEPSVEKDATCNSHIKYIIHLFDPLEENEPDNIKSDLKSVGVGGKLSDDSEFNFSLAANNLDKQSSNSSKIFPTSSEKPIVIPPNLKEGHYGKIKKVKSSTCEPEKMLPLYEEPPSPEPPPIPPRRIDMLPPKPPENVSLSINKRELKNEKCYSRGGSTKQENIPAEEKSKTADLGQWSSLKRVAKIVANNLENRASYISLSSKKSVKHSNEEGSTETLGDRKKSSDTLTLPQNFPKHSGVLYRPGGIQRWGVLSQRKLTLFANKDSPDVKDTVPMDSVLSVNVTHNKISMETIGVYCFEISTSTKNQLLLFGVPSVSERHIWMRKLLESIGPSFPTKLSMDYTKAGWCYAKESISCTWTKNCILLHNRTLYLSSESGSVVTADLRKARNLSTQLEGFPCENTMEKGPFLLIDVQDKTLYLQMDYERETKAWEVALTQAALKNGPNLGEQQLTKDDIPAIVDKCLNFVHTHGSFSEGIYRRNGSNRTVSQLLSAFRCNAWSVQLSREECSEFDVSSVLKRYFRDLPEPLLVADIHGELGKILEVTNLSEKIEKYKAVLKKLPEINYLTARRLMGHLHYINKQKDKNLMGSDNLAAVWGPTLMQVQEQVSLDSNCFRIEVLVISDLIEYYPEIFDVEKSEVEREMKILQMLETYHNNSNSLNKKPSGELKIWVYLHSPKNVDNCVNVSINPQKTAEEVCKELSSRTTDPPHHLCLEEVICNGHMTRPLHHSEKVLDTVLRWSYWDEADRKDNCLVLTKNELFRDVVHSTKFPLIVCEELKFADQKSKSFKSYQFEFSQAKLLCYKDKSCSQKIGEWKVEDIVWYLGHEPKRAPHGRWSITFIEKQFIGPRTKEKPYFGNTICGTTEEQKFKLISAMLMAQYAKDILPTPNFME